MEKLLFDLERILQAEVTHHERLSLLMQQERQYVIKGDLEQLGESNKQKETIILEIRMLEEGRIKVIEKLANSNNINPAELNLKRLILMVPPPFQDRFQGYFIHHCDGIERLTRLDHMHNGAVSPGSCYSYRLRQHSRWREGVCRCECCRRVHGSGSGRLCALDAAHIDCVIYEAAGGGYSSPNMDVIGRQHGLAVRAILPHTVHCLGGGQIVAASNVFDD